MHNVDDSGQWARVPEWLPIVAASPIVAFLSAIARAIWEDKEDSKARIAIEGLVCSFISIFVMSSFIIAALWLNIQVPIPDQYKIIVLCVISSGIGSFVGFLGAVQTRILIRKFLRIRVSK